MWRDIFIASSNIDIGLYEEVNIEKTPSPTSALSHKHCTHSHPYKCTRCPHSKHLIVWYGFNSSLLGHDVEWLVFLWGWCLVLRSAWLKLWMSNSQLWIEEVPQTECFSDICPVSLSRSVIRTLGQSCSICVQWCEDRKGDRAGPAHSCQSSWSQCVQQVKHTAT